MTELSEDLVLQALESVEDPELHRSIVELDMVRDVEVNGQEVRVVIALTVAGCPLKAEIERRVTMAIFGIEKSARVIVEMTVMSTEELELVREKIGGDAARIATSRPVAVPGARVLMMSSGKGGVGKSSVTVNLAVALAKQGNRVGILDADVYGFSVPKMLNIEEELETTEDTESIKPLEAHGVRVMSLGFFVEDDQPIAWRGPMLHKALEQFLHDVEWGVLDYLLVDLPPGTGDVALSMADFVPQSETIVVTTPQPAAARVAQRSGFMAQQLDQSVVGVVENMSWFTGDDGKRYELFGQGGGSVLAERLATSVLAQLPLVPELREGGDEGLPITVADPVSEAALAFEQLALMIEKTRPKQRRRPELKIS